MLQYELLFCIEDETDLAVAVVEGLIKKYPKVSAKLYKGATAVGVNPKINNMNKAFEDSLYEFILVSDSGIKSELFIFVFEIFHIIKFINFSSFCNWNTSLLNFSERRHSVWYGMLYDWKNRFSSSNALHMW